MYRVHLTEDQRRELTRRARAGDCPARTRERLEMVRLADAGWRAPRIAQHLARCEPTVRRWLATFLKEGFGALGDQPHPGQTSSLTPVMVAALKEEIAKAERTWSARQLAQWVEAHHGVGLSPEHLGRLLGREGLSYQRTARSVRHKQKQEEVEEKRADLETLEKGGGAGAWTSAT